MKTYASAVPTQTQAQAQAQQAPPLPSTAANDSSAGASTADEEAMQQLARAIARFAGAFADGALAEGLATGTTVTVTNGTADASPSQGVLMGAGLLAQLAQLQAAGVELKPLQV